MLKKLTLRNFQKHKKLEVIFDERVTTITGESDRGKSSILRALRWVARNAPTGSSFIRRGSKFCRVTLETDSCEVSRYRSASKNLYILGKESFSSFRNNVPEPVERALNLSDLNFQRQHDAPFWFNLRPHEVSKRLNAIVNLESIDSILQNIDKQLRQCRSEIKLSETRKEEALRKKESLRYIVSMKKEHGALTEQMRLFLLTRQKARILEEVLSKVTAATSATEREEKQAEELGHIVSLCKEHQRARDNQLSIERTLKSIEYEESRSAMDFSEFRAIQTKKQELEDTEKSIESLKRLLWNEKEHHCKIKTLTKELRLLEKEIHKARKGKCPLCGKDQ